MKMMLLVAAAAMSFCTSAFEVSVADREGHPLVGDPRFRIETRRVRGDGVETIRCRIRSLVASGPLLLRLVAHEDVPYATAVWDGVSEVPAEDLPCTRKLLADNRFLFGAAHDSKEGVVLALGAEDFTSFADLSCVRTEGGVSLSVEAHVALMEKGRVYECTFHRFRYFPKYGIRDAFARYYRLYPARFTRVSSVNPAVYGIAAQYACWTRRDPEACRFIGATWDWGYAAERSWGDVLNRAVPGGVPQTDYTWVDEVAYTGRGGRTVRLRNSEMSIAEFDAMLDERLSNGYVCGSANCFYTMALSHASKSLAKAYRDSVAGANAFAGDDYTYAAAMFTFPECSWGKALRADIAELVAKRDLAAIAFDVARPRSVYRGACLARMPNVGWDEFGPGVVRGVGSAKLFDYVRTLPNSRMTGKCAAVVNEANTVYSHLSDILYLDTMMVEASPWDADPPFPLQARLALGEKGLTLWEGFAPGDFDANFDKWPEDDKDSLLNDLSRYCVHWSFTTGASLPGLYLTEFVSRTSRAFRRMNAEGFKPVQGFMVEGVGWETARYGLGERSYLALCNGEREERDARATVFPDEIRTGIVGSSSKAPFYLYAPFFGGEALNAISAGEEIVSAKVGPQLPLVLECIGRSSGTGKLRLRWEGDFDAVRLVAVADSFSGAVSFRDAFETYRREGDAVIRFAPGETRKVVYRNSVLPGMAARIRAFGFPADRMAIPQFAIEYAPDPDSRDQAEAVGKFFVRAKRIENPTLRARTVALSGGGEPPLVVSAQDREDFARLVRRFLDVINAERYPDYAPKVRMPSDYGRHFTFTRL